MVFQQSDTDITSELIVLKLKRCLQIWRLFTSMQFWIELTYPRLKQLAFINVTAKVKFHYLHLGNYFMTQRTALVFAKITY